MILQQDGVPSHFSKQRLNETFRGRWIGRDHRISWAPCSLDLTSLNLSLCGYIKTKVSKTKVNDIIDLKKSIEQEIKALKKRDIRKYISEVRGRFEFFQQIFAHVPVSKQFVGVSYTTR